MPLALQDWMVAIETAWWLLFFTTFGLCLGSFLNVVIFRVPRDISLSNPVWSFCPGCQAQIRWYDNLPVISFLRLGGKCRQCGIAISPRYPLVEMLAALVVVLLLDAFFIERSRSGLSHDAVGMTWQLGDDWPVFLAHVILFASLLAMSAIDMEHYWVDIRFTQAATLAGFLLHGLWAPARFADWARPSPGWGAAALVATATTGLVLLLTAMFRRGEPEAAEAAAAPGGTELVVPEGVIPPPAETRVEPFSPASLCTVSEPVVDAPPTGSSPPPSSVASLSMAATTADLSGEVPAVLLSDPEDTGSIVAGAGDLPDAPARPATQISAARVAAIMTGLSLLVVLAGAWMAANRVGLEMPASVRWAPALGLMMLLIIGSAAAPRESDHAIVASIEAERHSSRRMVLKETALLLPAGLLGAVTLYYGLTCGNTQAMFGSVLEWNPWGDWRPLQGLATAALGFVVAAGIGWTVRILGTLGFGREAFGTGDIHMMAAAGCVAGWEVVLVGFALCSVLALGGWVATLPFKRARAIPLGPWLSLAFLLVVLFYEPIMTSPLVRNTAELFRRL